VTTRFARGSNGAAPRPAGNARRVPTPTTRFARRSNGAAPRPHPPRLASLVDAVQAADSEVGLCIAAHDHLVASGVKSRVVSMPSWELFEDQPPEYRDLVLSPEATARVVVEQASNFGWERYVGRTGHMITMRTFGASAPLKELQSKFGFASQASLHRRHGCSSE
jgi:hypothetical protein